MFYREKLNLILNSVADLISPPECKICSRSILQNKDRVTTYKKICSNCNQNLTKSKIIEGKNHCALCKRIIRNETTKISFCVSCRTNYENKLFLYSLYNYKNEVKNLVKTVKYQNDTAISKEIASKLIQEITKINYHIKLGSCPIIVPVPSTPERVVQRGFDSTYFLANQLALKLKLPIIEFELLSEPGGYKISHNPLTRINSGARKYKIKHKKNYSRLKNQNIILIDDVITTGATAIGLAKFLLKLGAEKVLILTIARSTSFTKLYLNYNLHNV